jgi:phosphate transport system substrate-binding protein
MATALSTLRCGLCLLLVVISCSSPDWSQNAPDIQIVGVGSTTPALLFSKWFEEYGKSSPHVRLRYMPQGSADGALFVTSGQADFGDTDIPLTDRQLARAQIPVLHFPIVVSGLVPVYNLANVEKPLRFSPQTLAGIYLGTIRRWNDQAMVELNPGVELPNYAIQVIHPAPGRGSTYVLSEYLSKVSAEWKTKVGRGSSISWPAGQVAEGNGNVARMVKETPGSIGVVELAFASSNQMQYGSVRNAAGKFVIADQKSLTAAAKAPHSGSTDFRWSLTNAPGVDAYPIATFSFVLVPTNISDSKKRIAITDFMHWILTEGQDYEAPLNYVPVPANIVLEELKVIAKIAGS